MGHWYQVRSANLGITYTGGWCLAAEETAFGTAHIYPSATADWISGEHGGDTSLGNHDGELPPDGVQVPVYLALGNVPDGDVAISLGDGRVAAAAMPGTHVGLYIYPSLQAYINDYGRANGGATLRGWSEGTANTRVVAYQPDITTNDVTSTEDVPFAEQTQDDSTLPVGQSQTVQAGVNGVRTIVTRTTYSDGTATDTEVISDVTTPSTPHIIANGTYVAPIPVDPPVVTPPTDPAKPINPTPPATAPVHDENWFVVLFKKVLQFLIGYKF